MLKKRFSFQGIDFNRPMKDNFGQIKNAIEFIVSGMIALSFQYAPETWQDAGWYVIYEPVMIGIIVLVFYTVISLFEFFVSEIDVDLKEDIIDYVEDVTEQEVEEKQDE